MGTFFIMFSPPAHAAIMDLSVFENSSHADTSQLNLWADIKDMGSYVDFTFHNDSDQAFISTIYFEGTKFSTGGLTKGAIVTPQPSGVNFSEGATPKNPPKSIKEYGGKWAGNLFAVDADSPSPKNGINPGETLTIRFDYNGMEFSDLLKGLSDPQQFRIAQHVQGLPKDASVWTVSQAIPLPAPILLLGLGWLFKGRRTI